MRNLLEPAVLDHAALVAAYDYPDTSSRPWLRANMVASVDGSARGTDGRSGSISGPADKRVFAVLRGLADVVLVGAGTARAEGYGPAHPTPDMVALRAHRDQRPAPTIAVVSGSLKLDENSNLFTSPSARPVVLTCASAPPERLRALRAVADVVVAGESSVDPVLAVQALSTKGLRRILCEGGPRLLGDLVAARVLDELCLTYSPHVVAGPSGRIVVGEPADAPLHLAGLLEEQGMLFARYLLQNPHG